MIVLRPWKWFKLNPRPSGKATHPLWAISHKKRVTIEVPEGTHELRIRKIAPRETSCLVRVRQPAPEVESAEP